MISTVSVFLNSKRWMVAFLAVFLFFSPQLFAEDTLRFSCSDQIYNAFSMEIIQDFSKSENITVDVYPTYSKCAMGRLVTGFSDVCAITHRLGYQMEAYGYVEIAFCRDPIAVITHESLSVKNISDKDFRNIFNRVITNWKELGGPDLKIILVIPGKNTEMYKNFYHLTMNRQPFQYDYIAYKSTKAIDLVECFPGAISFIARGAAIKEPGVSILNINGISPSQKDYPYYQTFSFVTKGTPEGTAKRFIDYALSEKGQKIIKERKMFFLSDEKERE